MHICNILSVYLRFFLLPFLFPLLEIIRCLLEDVHEVGRCDEAGLQAGKHNDQCNEDQENEVFADQSLDIFLFHFSFLLILQSRRPVS